MPREKLRETVKQLRNEIETEASLGRDQVHDLGEALSEIEAMLDPDVDDSADHSSILAKLREAEAHFEESHPNLTILVGAVATALSKLGI